MRQAICIGVMVLAVFVALFCLHGCSGVEIAAATAAAGGGSYAAYRAVGGVVDDICYAAGKEAAILGLKAVPSNLAPMVATDTIAVANNLLQFLQLNPNADSATVNAKLVECMGTLEPSMSARIKTAGWTLDEKLGPPGVSLAPLTPTELGFVASFVTGLRDGATEWLADNSVSVKARWTLRQKDKKRMQIQMHPGWLW